MMVMMGSFICILSFWFLKGQTRKKKTIVEGTCYVDNKTLYKMIKKKKMASKMILGGMPLIKHKETEHMMITGTTGSGKTNCLIELLTQIRARGDRVIVVDSIGTLVSKFLREGHDTLLNPFDARSVPWHLWAECIHPFHYDELAESLIPQSSHEPFWTHAARTVFSVAAKKLGQDKNYSIRELMKKTIEMPIKKVESFFEGTAAYSMMQGDAEKVALSIRSTLAAAIRGLEYLHNGQPSFSIREWVQRGFGDDWLFLTCTPEQRATMRPLLSAWLSTATKAMMGRNESATCQLWFIIDELPSLNVLPDFPKALAEIRKYGGCFVIGLQDLSQLDDLYGAHVTRSITGLTGTKVAFRSPDAFTAKRVSEFLGEQKIIEPMTSISFGAHQYRDGVNLSDHRTIQNTVSYTDLLKLDNLEAYLQLPGNFPVTKIKFQYHIQRSIAASFIQGDLPVVPIVAGNDDGDRQDNLGEPIIIDETLPSTHITI